MTCRPPRHAILFCLLTLAAAGPGAEPTAGDPAFDDRSRWPHVAGTEPFVVQDWPATRTLVWAHPGRDGGGRGGLDPTRTENWLMDGKPLPAGSPPPDERTDIVLPGSDTPYQVRFPLKQVRHLTVGRNCEFHAEGRRAKLSIHGNAWIHEGGMLRTWTLVMTGGADTFFRDDNAHSRRTLGQWIYIQKFGGSSVELVGHVRSGDEIKFDEGVASLHPHAEVTAGLPSILIVGPEATLRLHSGSRFFKRENLLRNDPDLLVQGRLEGGSPERPLTGDAFVGISYKYTDKLMFMGVVGGLGDRAKQVTTSHIGLKPYSYGLILEEGGAMAVHSADPQRARLVIDWHRLERSGKDTPRLINMALLGDTSGLDGIAFDHLHAGGIALPDLSVRSSWGAVHFGPNCAARGDALFSVFDPAGQPGREGQSPVQTESGD